MNKFSASIFMLVLAAFPALTAPDISARFGPRVHPKPAGICLSGDFDGDGAIDIACLVGTLPASKQSYFAPDVTVIDRFFASKPLSAQSKETALIILQKGGKQKFLIAGQGYFDTPVWTDAHTAITVAKPGSKAYRDFQHDKAPIRHDILTVATEAGIDMAIYWNGKNYALFTPDEEP